MNNLFVEIEHSGGDADIDYYAFMVLSPEEYVAFKEVAAQVVKRCTEDGERFHIRVDCDDYVGVHLNDWQRKKTPDEVFFDGVKTREITPEETKVLKKFFRNLHYGNEELFNWVFNSDEWYQRFGNEWYEKRNVSV